jgi:hypothetical protein
MATRPPEHKPLIDAIIDAELEAKQMVEAIIKGADGTRARMRMFTRQLVALRMAGKVNGEQATQMLARGIRDLLLAEYAQHVGTIVAAADAQHEREMQAIKQLGKPLKEVGAIRNADIKARELERAGATDDEGRLTNGE